MRQKLATIAIASLVALNPLYAPVVFARQFVNQSQIAKNATEEGYWGLSQTKTLEDIKLESSGGFVVTDPRVHAQLGYDPSRQWSPGQSAADILRVGESDELFKIKNLTPRQLAQLSGQSVNSIPLLSLFDQSTIGDLIKINPEIANAPVESISAVRDLAQGNYSSAIKNGIVVAENYSQEIKDFLTRRPEYRNLPIGELLKGDFRNSIPAAQQIAFAELSRRLPDEFKTLPVKSLPALTDLTKGNLGGAFESGFSIAVDHFDTLEKALENHPELREVPIADIVNGKWDRVLSQAEKIAFDKLGKTLPPEAEKFGGKAIPLLKAAREGDFNSVYQIAAESIKGFNDLLEEHPELKDLPINEILRGNSRALANKTQQVALQNIARQLPDAYQGLPAKALDALYDLKDGRWENTIEKGVQISGEYFKDVQGFFKEHPELANVSISEVLQGDFDTAIDAGEEAALKRLEKINPYLSDLPLGALARGNFDQALDQGIKIGAKYTVEKLLDENPALQDVALGALDNPRYSIGSVEGLADTAIGTIDAIDSKLLSDIPGLNKIPLDVLNANNISALLKGDLFGRIDLVFGEEEGLTRNALSGFTRGKKFTPKNCNVDEPKTDHCAHAELRDFAGLFGSKNGKSLLGKQFVSGGHKGKGGWGFLKDIGNGGYEKAGLSVFGVSTKTSNMKLVINKVSEVDGEQTTTPSGYRIYTESGYIELGLTFGLCIKTLFIDTCTSSFIDLPTEFIPKELIDFKVAEGGRVLIATTSPPPRIPDSLWNQYANQYGIGNNYCAAAPPDPKSSGSKGDGTYQELSDADKVYVGEYDLTRIGASGTRSEYLHKETAGAFEKMRQAAAKDGVDLGISSGFRSIADQQSIWDGKRADGQTDEEIAKVNTRPGKSQHHTGYSLDIVDLNRPDTDFNNEFRNTTAGEWLNQNAAKYGFEKSYPNEDNNGIQREEWDWRFIGSKEARVALNLESDGSGDEPIAVDLIQGADGKDAIPVDVIDSGDGDKAIASVGETAWGNSRDRANLLMTSIFESTGTQNQVDVAVSIMNRVVSSQYPDNATDVTFQENFNPSKNKVQYAPNWQRHPVNSKGEAISRLAREKFGGDINSAQQNYEQLEQALSNPQNIISAQNHIGGATDFRGFDPETRFISGDPYRGDPRNPNGAANFFVQESRSVQVATATLEHLGIGSDRFTGISDGLSGGGVPCIASGGSSGPIINGDGIATGQFVNPLPGSVITSPRGWRTHPKLGGTRFHKGIDLSTNDQNITGAPVNAIDGGTVLYVQNQCLGQGDSCGGRYGNRVEIDHGNGIVSIYNHLHNVDVVQGQPVSRGQQIGGEGKTGGVTGVHLDFELTVKGQYVDPAPYLGF